jgi:hypothetical protein
VLTEIEVLKRRIRKADRRIKAGHRADEELDRKLRLVARVLELTKGLDGGTLQC